jgi:hypothetical protein|tara:strand:- start:246 stop:473 length:228 start_codon:yes stop_codon:yes gene_type:complete
MHPNIEDLSLLTDMQIEQKIQKLNSVYFATDNESVRHQIVLLIDTYKVELETRRSNAKLKQQNNNNGLDSLIKVS